MSTIQPHQSTALVRFRGEKLPIVEVNSQPYVPMKPIVEALGLDWKTQHKLITRDLVLSTIAVTEIVASSDGSKREMLCLPLEYLNGWLFKVPAARYKGRKRDVIIQYQKECYHALHEYWFKNSPINQAVEKLQDLEKNKRKELPLTEAMLDHIARKITGKVKAMVSEAAPRLVNAATAAGMVGMARSSWSCWKNQNSINGKTQVHFPFTIYSTDAGDRYDVEEIMQYIHHCARKGLRSNKKIATTVKPSFTPEDLPVKPAEVVPAETERPLVRDSGETVAARKAAQFLGLQEEGLTAWKLGYKPEWGPFPFKVSKRSGRDVYQLKDIRDFIYRAGLGQGGKKKMNRNLIACKTGAVCLIPLNRKNCTTREVNRAKMVAVETRNGPWALFKHPELPTGLYHPISIKKLAGEIE